MPRKKLLSDKSQIIDLALRLLETEGLEAVSMRRLSKEMGVSSKTLYNYVLNADAVLRDILVRCFSGMYASVFDKMNEMIASGMDSSLAYARSYALALYDFSCEHRNICIYMVGPGYEAYHNDAELRPLYDPFSMFLMGMEDGEENRELSNILVLYKSSVDSLIRNHLSGIMQLSKEEYTELIDLLLAKLMN